MNTMNTQISGMKKYLKFWEYKRLLRVRGIEDLEKEIKLKLVNFELLIDEAQSFHEACQDLNLIYPIVREHLKLSNKSLAGLDLKKEIFQKITVSPLIDLNEDDIILSKNSISLIGDFQE